jgi:flagellar motor protein MotB
MAVTILIITGIITPALAENAISERIYFVQQDGRHALVYTTSRTNYKDYSIWFDDKEDYTQEDYLKNFLYLFPNNGEWDSDPKPGYQILKLPNGNFASLEWADLEADGRLQVDSNGVYYYQNWDGTEKTPDGHYGLWNSPGNFEQIAYSWVFPENLEPLYNAANQPGDWVQRHNTVTYYGTDVNDLTFNIQYRPSTSSAYEDFKDMEGEGIAVEQQATGVKVTLAETLLFPTGVAEVSSAGNAVLKQLSDRLKERTSLHIVIAGHTDNVPISASLAKKYPTNWELSSARSINIIHQLVNQGVAQERFESQAFSYMRPVASNATAEGRAKNRRIEVYLTEDETLVMETPVMVEEAVVVEDDAVEEVEVTETQ